jgi:hypothetical protein
MATFGEELGMTERGCDTIEAAEEDATAVT